MPWIPLPPPALRLFHSFGIVKGLFMAPLIIPVHVIGCTLISLLMIFTFIDQGYFTLRL